MVSLKPLAEQAVIGFTRGRSLYGAATGRPLLTALALLGAGLAASALVSRQASARRQRQFWQPHPRPVPERHSDLHLQPEASRPHRAERPRPAKMPRREAGASGLISTRPNGPDSTPVATTSPTGVSHF